VLSGSVVELREVRFEGVPGLHVLIASDPTRTTEQTRALPCAK